MSDTEPAEEENVSAQPAEENVPAQPGKKEEDLDTLLLRCQNIRQHSSVTELSNIGTSVYQRLNAE